MVRHLVVFCTTVGLLLIGGFSQPFGLAEEPAAVDPIVSQDPAILLTHASIVFYKARRLMATDRPAAEQAFREIQTELQRALDLAKADSDEPRRAMVGSQSAFMLGDVARYVFNDSTTAKAFYEEALRLFPEHDGATQALGSLVFQGAIE